MSLLRPSCAIARRLCTSQAPTEGTIRSPILSLLRRHATSRPQCRSFSHTPRFLANVIDTPHSPTNPHQQKHPARTVRIGPLPGGRVSDDVIRRIFGRRLSPAEGNNVLRILHHRRTSGSLADYGVDNLGKIYTHVDRALALKGLDWLREKYPVDEAVAAEQWAEKEANRISYELWLADPETESKYKDPARAFREQMKKEEEERQQQALDDQKIGILHVGKSQFERNIEEKRQARLAEATRKAELKEQREKEMEAQLATGEWVKTPSGKQLMKPHQTTYIDIFGNEQVSRRSEERAKYEQKAVTGFKDETEMLSKTTLVSLSLPLLSVSPNNQYITGPTSLPNDCFCSLCIPLVVGFRALLHTAISRIPYLPRSVSHDSHYGGSAWRKHHRRSRLAHHAPLALHDALLHARTWISACCTVYTQRILARAVRTFGGEYDDAMSCGARVSRPRRQRTVHGHVHFCWCGWHTRILILGEHR